MAEVRPVHTFRGRAVGREEAPSYLLSARTALDMSQQAMAYAMGVSVATVSRIERGIQVPSHRLWANTKAVLAGLLAMRAKDQWDRTD